MRKYFKRFYTLPLQIYPS